MFVNALLSNGRPNPIDGKNMNAGTILTYFQDGLPHCTSVRPPTGHYDDAVAADQGTSSGVAESALLSTILFQ